MTITLGSLFDGIGVFPLAASRHGILPVWASEIIPDAISITKRHFPELVHLGDITKLDGGKIPAVHVITFGSPCQNLSSIGPRDGLSGAKSSLFYQAIRIIEEMRDASGGLYPAIIVWENVIGAMQQNLKMTILPYSNPSRAPKFQCLILDTGQMPEWCEGDGVIWHGVSWTRSIGRGPGWPVGKESLLWQILQDSVPQRYYLTPGQCTRILGFAARVGCPPPKIIEALLLKQGGRYPLSCPFTDSKCAEQPQTEIDNTSSGALESGQMCFQLF